MLSVGEAFEIISKQLIRLDRTTVPIRQAPGFTLCEDVHADRPFPPFDRVSMDGIGIKYESFVNGVRSYPIDSVAPAGQPQVTLGDPSHCVEVMTGAQLPSGTDTVIRYEDLEIDDGVATLMIDDIREGQNVHKCGLDRQKGETLISAHMRITSAEMNTLATVGMADVPVFRKPRVAVVATGDELVAVSETPEPYQIRSSNMYSIGSALEGAGAECTFFHLRDELDVVESSLAEILKDFDVIVLSGGVSKGKFDYVPDALENLGVEKLFHRVQQRPGKPFWFGAAGDQSSVVFALPGNPVSTLACTARYIIPWLELCHGRTVESRYATLKQQIDFKPDLTLLQQASLSTDENGRVWATPIIGKGSGDLASLIGADGFIELPQGRNSFQAGEVHRFWPV